MDTTYTTGHVQPTIEEEDEDYSDEEQEEEFVSRSVQPSPNYRPYQPGNHLEPIMTGETLQIDDDGNPFDPGYYLAGPSYLPPMPPATPAGYDHYSDQDYLPPSRPVSAFSMSQGPSYQSVHEDEAYPPGNYPHNSFRSRSPTPAVDDEDYHIVGNVVRFTGTPEKVKAYDPEKYADQLRYSQYSSAYAYKDNYGKPPVNEAPVETKHYGPAPAGRVLRRHKTKKRVQLTNGNLVVDVDVPPKLVLPRRGEPETLQTRYTAVTCDPDHFEKKGFFLRQNENGRRTELFIVITMYNEDEVLFCRTLYGVMQNIAHLCTRKNSRTWGPDAWQKVVVCIVADGRRHVHPRVLDVLTLLGVYQPGGHMKNFVNQQEVTAHLFEYTTSFGMDSDLKFKFPDKGVMPTQIIFCLKEKNQKKINSHRWFFNAFGQMLQPNVCILLDVGTRPGKTSLYRLWKAFDVNSSVGGACGEISAYKGKHWLGLLNPLVAAQNFEYKMSSILDKPTESMFGYISVLPGAFSAYRYIALQNDKCGIGPLASYFKGEVLHGRDTDIFTSNMYLAEDRILCFELIAKAKSAWLLKYVKSAVGETDVPESLPEFISQRRRWLNGSFFAATYAIAHLGQVMNSGHSFTRKVLLFFETGYNIVNLVFAWFSLGNFYLFFVVLTSSLTDPIFHLQGIYYFNTVIQYIFTSLVVVCFLLSMGLKPQAAPFKYKITSIALGVCMLYMFFCSIMCSLQAVRLGGVSDHVMMFSVVITYGLYLFSSILAFDPWHMLTSFIPYLLLSPTYVNILNIYAFANLDDISWGTKEDTTAEPDLGAVVQDSRAQVAVEVFTEPADINVIYEDALFHLKNRTPNKSRESPLTETERELVAKHYYASVRTNLLLAWVLSNGVLIIAILAGSDPSATFSPSSSEFNRTKAYLIFILVFTTMTNLTRFGGSILYLLHRFVFG